MDFFTDTFGFEGNDLDAATKELARVLDMTPELHFYEGVGGDCTLFGELGKPGGRLLLYLNHSADVDGPITQEDDFPELGLILLVEQRNEHVDYEPKLRQMETFKPILLYRSRRLESKGKTEVLFDLAKDRSKQTR